MSGFGSSDDRLMIGSPYRFFRGGYGVPIMACYARNYSQLDVYRAAMKLTADIFEETKKLPREEMYALTDQVRRSSRAIGAQIAEAWGKRRYRRHFVSKLTDADSERLETQHWIKVAADCAYLSAETVAEFQERLTEIGAMLNSMILKAHRFCVGDRVC